MDWLLLVELQQNGVEVSSVTNKTIEEQERGTGETTQERIGSTVRIWTRPDCPNSGKTITHTYMFMDFFFLFCI